MSESFDVIEAIAGFDDSVQCDLVLLCSVGWPTKSDDETDLYNKLPLYKVSAVCPLSEPLDPMTTRLRKIVILTNGYMMTILGIYLVWGFIRLMTVDDFESWSLQQQVIE